MCWWKSSHQTIVYQVSFVKCKRAPELNLTWGGLLPCLLPFPLLQNIPPVCIRKLNRFLKRKMRGYMETPNLPCGEGGIAAGENALCVRPETQRSCAASETAAAAVSGGTLGPTTRLIIRCSFLLYSTCSYAASWQPSRKRERARESSSSSLELCTTFRLLVPPPPPAEQERTSPCAAA